ncbi:hypothetical protein SAMN04487851_1138 [Prevotella sp. tc2-28]|nr:hypothetical protein SAMN04487851_1138 [Prevotella sp. tc2-28]
MGVAAILFPWFILFNVTSCIRWIILANAHTEKTEAVIVGYVAYPRAGGYDPYMFELNGHIYTGKKFNGPSEVGDTIIVEYWPFMPEVNAVWGTR